MSAATSLDPVEALPAAMSCRDDWAARAAVIAEVAARHAQEVDREGRFPAEAVQAMRDSGLLAAWVPQSLGGPGLSLRQIRYRIERLNIPIPQDSESHEAG